MTGFPFRAAVAALALFTAQSAHAAADPQLDALPLTPIAATGDGDTLAVLYSGDGGWAALDRGVAAGLTRGGVPVVGYDSLRYFLTKRTPETAAADLARVLRHYLALWGKSRIILVGYSFGADALPAIIPDLPADLRDRVRMVTLISPDTQGELQFRPGDWFNVSSASAYPLAPALTRLKGPTLICLYGDQEARPACPAFPQDVIRGVRLPGDHHYGGDYGAVSAAILAALSPSAAR
jgi:type IV secretory pathway VirJ component